MNDSRDPIKRAKRARAEAEKVELDAVDAWFREAKAALDARTDLSDAERRAAKNALYLEVGKRANQGLGRAKRQNTAPALMEREARERLAAKR